MVSFSPMGTLVTKPFQTPEMGTRRRSLFSRANMCIYHVASRTRTMVFMKATVLWSVGGSLTLPPPAEWDTIDADDATPWSGTSPPPRSIPPQTSRLTRLSATPRFPLVTETGVGR